MNGFCVFLRKIIGAQNKSIPDFKLREYNDLAQPRGIFHVQVACSGRLEGGRDVL